MKKKKLLLTLLISFCMLPLAAQLEAGKVYRFVNNANPDIAMASASNTEARGAVIEEGNYTQLWYVDKHPGNSSAWSLRSLGNGLYLQHSGMSSFWSFQSNPATTTPLYLVSVDRFYTFNSSNSTSGYTCMHYATSQGGAIVGWTSNAGASQWIIQEVEVSAEDLQKNWEELEEFNSVLTDEYQARCAAALGNLFSDAACTVLKKSFANVAAMEADEDYKVLPSTLQDMVKKVYTGDWSEPNYDSSKPQWDSEYGKKFRVQSYEPYSIAGDITDWLAINAHINMDNPTGLFANMRQHIYVMVEGEIKSGATLYLHSLAGHGLVWNGTEGVQLHEGLNIVPFSGNGNALYMTYTVDTYGNDGKTFRNELSGYPNLKIHIEGGNINGYYNAVGDHIWGEPDDDNDWLYYEERYNLENITILGKRQILHFCADENVQYTDDDGTHTVNGMTYYLPERVQVPAGTPANQKINKMVEAWDRIHLSELITMGLLSKEEVDSLNALYPGYRNNWKEKFPIFTCNDEFYEFQGGRDYSEYFNHHGVAYGNFSGYMSGGWQNCNYHHNTMGAIIGEIALKSGPTWGPAHEIGHQHQAAMNLNGLTEVTNNLFSNVAVWYMGIGTARMNGTEGNLAHVYDVYSAGGDFFDNNIWALTHMYYRLWLYYHLAGHNTNFFPRLYECLRNERMPRVAVTTGKETILRFYRHACVAAGEDLTEFFRAHGIFKVMTDRHVGDYANSDYTQSQEDIDEAIAWVKAKGYKENIAPLFINDCAKQTTYSHDGKTRREYWDPATEDGKNATIGMYTDFDDLSVVAENYLYTMSNGTVKITADSNSKGAVGFIVYNGDNLVAFTNNYSVTLPITAGNNVQVYAVQADGTKVEIPTAAEAGSEEQQLAALTSAINTATSLLNYSSDDANTVGYFYSHAVAELKSILEGAKAAKENSDQSVHSYGKWATMLTNEVNKVSEDKYARIRIKEGNIHTIDNRGGYLAYYDYALKGASASQVPASSNDRRWEFVSTGVDNEFYIKNVGQNKFITSLTDEGATLTSNNTELAVKFTATYTNDGMMIFTIANESSNAISIKSTSDKSVIAASPTATLSEWRVRIVENKAKELESAKLNDLITEANRVIDEVGVLNGNTLTINENVTNAANNLQMLILAVNTALEDAEANMETAVDLSRYIDALQAAIANTEDTYILIPEANKAGFITWYYIKNNDGDTFCGVDTENGSATYSMAVSLGDLAKDDKNYWWAFEPTGNENEYKIYNAGQNNYLYTTSRSFLKADGKEEAGVYTVTVDAENGGLLISEGKKYWNNSNKNYSKVTTAKSYWKIMRIGSEETGIEEVLGTDENTENAIYDMYGRKVNEITESGIYIINGKKVLVK